MYREELQREYTRKNQQLKALKEGIYTHCMARDGWPMLERCRRITDHDGGCRFGGKEEEIDMHKTISRLQREVNQLYLMLLPDNERREIL